MWHLAAPGILALLVACASPTSARNGDLSAPHVFLLIGDGMGLETEILASRYLSGRNDGLAWQEFAFQAWVATWDTSTYNAHAAAQSPSAPSFGSAAIDLGLGYDGGIGGNEPWPLEAATPDARVAYYLAAATDSASAATAMSTGEKTSGGAIAWKDGSPSPTNGALLTIAESMRSRLGASIGIVSTVPFNHATPAAFVAHSASRNNFAVIAEEIIGSFRPEVVIGGGHPAWCQTYFSTAELVSLKSSPYWRVVERSTSNDGGSALMSALPSVTAGMGLFGLFGGADGAFETQRPLNSPGSPSFIRNTVDPSLAQALICAASVLARDSDGFFLMAEQGDIDWAGHANDLPRAIGAVAALSEAVAAVTDFVDRPGDNITWANSLLIVTADHATGLPRYDPAVSFGKGELPDSLGAGRFSYAGIEVKYATTGYGNELVTIAARGDRATDVFATFVGEGRPGTRIIENTAIFRAIAAFSGLD